MHARKIFIHINLKEKILRKKKITFKSLLKVKGEIIKALYRLSPSPAGSSCAHGFPGAEMLEHMQAVRPPPWYASGGNFPWEQLFIAPKMIDFISF